MSANGRKMFGAFTLLEVMVAVAILAIALTAIFGSQAGAIRAGARARHMTTATLLARCKMGEIEEQLMVDGFPAVSLDGNDACCEGGEQDGFTCEWHVERIELPDSLEAGGGDGDPLGLGGDHAADDGASAADLEQALSGAAGGDMLGDFAVQYAWPVLRPAIEEQVRRATVTVQWLEGEETRSFDVVQYVVADQGMMDPNAGQVGAGQTGTGQTGAGGNTPGAGTTAPQVPQINLPGMQR